MRPSLRNTLLATALLAAALGLYLWAGSAPPPSPSVPALAQPSPLTQTPTQPSPWAAHTTEPAAASAPARVTQSTPVIAGAEPAETVMFQLNAQGQVVTDEAARLAIEKLFALNDAPERQRKLRLLQDSLPPEAARELGALMARFDSYQEAQFQTLPPGQELRSLPEALNQLDRLSALRQQYFGTVVAAGFFGAEEKAQRELLHRMALDTTPGSSFEDKAARALRTGG